MKTKSVHIGNWEVCCNDMMIALLEDNIQATDPVVEELLFFINEGSNLNWCPWCKANLANTAHQYELDQL